MTKQMIKAIRLVNGLNPDLRIKLNGIKKEALYDWLEDNYYGVFGLNAPPKPKWNEPEWDKYESKMWLAVRDIIEGLGD